ncbi:ATP-binding sensor histidine kinase [Pseudanabaena sp. UWO310]|uniref:trifunctional serine/threonine-protein kinase/ATP-binding protein/sensor histidine kinase n=1 Tax=Pseudanabaena sp. UWO310 TaxID=2480795 RepID=UPI001158E463|nr:ATP-binding sensor histidine kinase [Pseudanabaena sp. UWO310]TYQ31002.1 AAA family ATPase [Pseudanabaena sp. UWO310]
MVDTFTILGYSLSENLYMGSRTVVYRAIRTSDQLPVVIKLLKNDYPTFNELVQFRNQYNISQNFNSPLIIQTYSLEPYQNSYALVMEDFGGISLREYAVKGRNRLSLKEFLEIAIALCNGLDILYRDRVIHKDIKPSNILINPETNQVKLIDFSIASLLPRETQEIQNANALEGTLAYLSPEQTGRMNRGVDYRSDFYSLGVTFYELLAGKLPFQSNDPVELVHCHLAKNPTPVHQINPSIPLVLSTIISKLMAKNAEDRYQSALGIKHDLEICLEQLQATGNIAPFEIGQRDISDRFIIPEKLYGRATEVEILLNSFERVSQGATEMMLVAGFSGIGKTAVVNEVHKPIVRQRGYFIKGKYDQFQRNIPFFAFVQAFRDLMGQLLSESDSQINGWKNKILKVVGENGQVLIEVIPELELIIGQQPVATVLSGTATQNRFNLLMQKFVQIFTSPEHPLVMFLDDLQWADSASLNLLKLLIEDTQYLLIIGAYRDNEVSPAHPFMITIDEIIKSGALVNTITLKALSLLNVNQLVADTLNCELFLAQALTELIYQKTNGNPFFTTQFLKTLYEDGQITFDWDIQHWRCDINQVRSLAITDDVVEFMALQLQKLPIETQEVLKLAACIGAHFDLQTLAIVSKRSPEDTATALWRALQEGLIIPISDVYKFFAPTSALSANQVSANATYKFLHDRVQQSAYSLIAEEQKQFVHLQIGQLLLAHRSSTVLEDKIFDIVNHLAVGIDADPSAIPTIQLAELSVLAGMKAKLSVAYQAAIGYFSIGLKRLPQSAWQTHYRLMLDLHREKAECSYLVGQFESSESLLAHILKHVKDPLDMAHIYGIRMTQRMTQGTNMMASVEDGIKGLSVLGITLPTDQNELQALVEVERRQVQETVAQISAQALLDLPPMSDPVQQSCMKILVILYSASYLAGNQLLNLLTTLRMVNISLKYGRAESSSFAYCSYGMMLALQGDYQDAYQFGKIALDLDRTFNNTQFIAKNNNHFAHSINPFSRPLSENVPLYEQSIELCMEFGDLVFGVWAIVFLIWSHLFKGSPLPSVQEEIQKYLGYVQQANDQNMLCVFQLQQQFVKELMDDTIEGQELTATGYFEHPFFLLWKQSHFDVAISWYGFLVLQRAYFRGDYAQVLAISPALQDALPANMGFFPIIAYHIYYPLSLAAAYTQADSETQAVYYQQIQEQQQMLKKWAKACPDNFLHKHQLISAELARLSGDRIQAVDLYDRAILGARENGYIQEEAIANELAAKFYLDWDKERIAQEYMTEAYYGYARWGAKAKVADLERRYPQLLAFILEQPRSLLSTSETIFAVGSTSTSSDTSHSSASVALDLATILKASQTLSGEIELEKLLSALLSIVIENAGADKCIFMLLRDDRLLIKGSIIEGAEPVVLQKIPVEDSQDVPLKLIYKVQHSRQTAVLIDATADPTLASDAYIIRQQPKSILCSPILQQGKLKGILYLENSLAAGAFTRDRVEILNLLCAQAAISLENARLYERSLEYAQQLERSLENLSASNSRFEKLVDNVPGVVYQARSTSDGDRYLSYVSAECSYLFEITQEQAIANIHFLIEAIHPEDVASYQQSLTNSRQTLAPLEWSGRIVTPSGIIKWIEIKTRVQQLDDGTLVWDGLVLDISKQQAALHERKLAEIALEQKSQVLQQVLTDLQNAQLQMVQSEKMSALGNLVAGVAHEMNNPLGFIAVSLKQAEPTLADIVEHLKLYQENLPNPSDEIKAHAEEIDLEYSLEDLPKMIDSMTIACDRLKNISTSLRTFSRADQDYKVLFDIHQGIDSTILILKHRLKASDQHPAIEVVTNYGNLPQIACFPGQLNQVFMNILANAIDALEESNQGKSFEQIKAHPNRITITTSLDLENNLVKIVITDNGKGMKEEVKQKVFDHLFTTKSVGKGTGLGLAIARQIVTEKHCGTIQVNSLFGEGTEMLITLPISTESSSAE